MGNTKCEMRSGKWETRSGKWEVGSGRHEVRSGKYEFKMGIFKIFGPSKFNKNIWFVSQTTLLLQSNLQPFSMENTEKLHPAESLAIISKAMEQTKENIKEQGFYFTLWGWIISITAFCNYLLVTLTDLKYHYLPWLVLIPMGWAISIIHSMQRERSKHYETYFEVFLKHLWVVIGIAFIPIVFIAIQLKTNPTGFVLLLAGVGTLVSGLTMKFKPLKIGGITFFLFTIASLYVDEATTLLLTGLAVIIGYLIPAYLLKSAK